MANVVDLSLGEIIDEVVENDLVDFCYVARDVVRVSIGGNVMTYPSDEASSFLKQLLRGWRRTPSAVQTYMSAATLETHLTSLLPSPRRREEEAEQPPRDVDDTRLRWSMQYDNYLDLLLAMSKELGLIVGFTKHPKRHAITVLTRATAVEMSYVDAFEYLSETVVEEIRRRVSI